jgi:hypothetical protein
MSSAKFSVDKLVWVGIGLAFFLTLAFWLGFAVGDAGLAAIMNWFGRLFA